jgi:hypothetical protein
MQVSILDPGMIYHHGHNRQMNIALAKELMKRGIKPTIFSHEHYELMPEDCDFPFKIVPHFSVSPYGEHFQVKKGSSATELDVRYAKQLRMELSRIDLGAMSMSTTFWPYMLLAASEIPNMHLAACIQFHPEVFHNLGEVRWKFAFAKAAQTLTAFDICVVEPDLQKVFEKLSPKKTKISVAPFPIEIGEMPVAPTISNKIGILGGHRPEQGQTFLPNIVNSVLNNGFKVLLQDSKGNLEAPPHPDVEIVGQVKNMEDSIMQCEALVLHYSPTFYSKMGSGLMWESILHGVPTLHTNNTLPGKNAQRLGAGISFDYQDTKSFGDALALFRKQKTVIQTAARQAAVKARTEHGISKFVDYIMKSKAWPK